jgi:hypothetical protein
MPMEIGNTVAAWLGLGWVSERVTAAAPAGSSCWGTLEAESFEVGGGQNGKGRTSGCLTSVVRPLFNSVSSITD